MNFGKRKRYNMMIIKNIIKATIATTAVISSAFAMVLPGNALSPVTY